MTRATYEPMPTGWPPEVRSDQGRNRAYGEDGTPEGSAIGGLMLVAAFWLVVALALIAYGSAS